MRLKKSGTLQDDLMGMLTWVTLLFHDFCSFTHLLIQIHALTALENND